MNGGSWEYVMGVFANSSGSVWSGLTSESNSGFTGKLGSSGTSYTGISLPNIKYYDIYKATSGNTITSSTACGNGICYGHAFSETSKWYSDFESFISDNRPWVVRSGGRTDADFAGIFFYHSNYGHSISSYSTRPVIAPIQ